MHVSNLSHIVFNLAVPTGWDIRNRQDSYPDTADDTLPHPTTRRLV